MKKIYLLVSIAFCLNTNAQHDIMSTVAGNGTGAFAGNGGQATMAELYSPNGVTFDAAGNLYIADLNNNRIRKVIVSTGIISTYAGNGTEGFSGDGGQATAAELYAPAGLRFDASGNLYIADALNNRIRKVTTAGIISNIAGNGTGAGNYTCTTCYSGDGGQATAAKINNPNDVAVDAHGNVYIADQTNNRVRKVTTAGIISTFAGNGTAGYTGNGGQATAAELNYPAALAFDAAGNLYIADYDNNEIRKVTTAGIISLFAGHISGIGGYGGDGGAASGSALLSGPTGLAFDATGNLYIADAGNSIIRVVNTAGIINLYAGEQTTVGSYDGDGYPLLTTTFNYPCGLVFDAAGNLYIADNGNNRIRKPIACTITTANNPQTICEGGSYLFALHTYTATGTYADTLPTVRGQCDSIIITQLTVNPKPVVTISSPTVCPNNYVHLILTASGANTYTWYTGNTPISSPTVAITDTLDYGNANPAYNGMIYNVVGANTFGCTDTTVITTNQVQPTPTISVVQTNSVICLGSSITYTASGANTYSWSTSSTGTPIIATTAVISVTPTATANYYAFGTGAANTCTNTNSAYGYVTVHVGPNQQATALIQGTGTIDTVICLGGSCVLYAENCTINCASSYTWSANAGSVSSETVLVSPTVSTIYSLTTNASGNGCSTTAIVSITVNPLPTVSASSNTTTVCAGSTTTLTASGASTYTWNTSAHTPTIAITPTVTTTYTVTGTGSDGCNNMTTVTQTVTNCTTGLEQVANSNEVNIYPNPNNGSFVIEPSSATKQTMQMYDVNGKIVLSQTINGKTNIDANSLNEGVYNISISSNEGTVNKRIVIVK
jgi:sugar lactone lactonase YvrE